MSNYYNSVHLCVNKYLDFNDYKTPIKSYVDDRYYYYILPSGCKLSRVYLQQNIAILNDDYFGTALNIIDCCYFGKNLLIKNLQINYLMKGACLGYQNIILILLPNTLITLEDTWNEHKRQVLE